MYVYLCVLQTALVGRATTIDTTCSIVYIARAVMVVVIVVVVSVRFLLALALNCSLCRLFCDVPKRVYHLHVSCCACDCTRMGV